MKFPLLAVNLLAGVLLLGPEGAHAATVFVKTLGDSGPGSLRSALTYANAHPNSTVAFAVPRALLREGVATIRPARPLPVVRANGTRIDGTSQGRFVGDTNPEGPEVVLDGSQLRAAPNQGAGLVIEAAGCRLSGLGVQSFVATGIEIRGKRAQGNRVAGCTLGADARGRVARPNGVGLAIIDGANHNQVGGTTPSARNLISGNEEVGIVFSEASANTVQGCLIGVDATGRARLPNGTSGVLISDGSTSNLIGGAQPGVRNVISGNGWEGVMIIEASKSNKVQGNFIGVDESGARELGNLKCGVHIESSTQNLIGGSEPGAGNILSGNARGISILYSEHNTVQGNFVGTDASGAQPVPNTVSGIEVRGDSSSNTIGGAEPGARNVISGNARSGVLLTDAGTKNNIVRGNLIGTGANGADLLGNGPEGVGIYLGAGNNLIGGSGPGQANTIAYRERAIVTDQASAKLNQTENNLLDPLVVGRWAVGQNSPSFAPRDWDVTPFVKAAGEYVIGFQYTAGVDQLEMEWVELLENGRSVARDAHGGRTGYQNANNEYHLTLPTLTPGAAYTLRASVKSAPDSNGEVRLRRAGPNVLP